ncbi:DUF3850 domain-containing protein [Erwinia psidii]|uniref:DUF3850 domain-containing protein n=1 Tax=Erwinia psidii TaxID=69224 RepID=UPI0022787B26|nr:DUF3850 domain-containing protein [Erwinia psidii]
MYFNAVVSGDKKAELRVNDRDFKCGDFLLLREWDGVYKGSKLLVKVTHILPLGIFSITSGWVVLSISPINENDTQLIINSHIEGEQ